MFAQRSWVELTRVEPVYTDVQHTRIIIENTGRPVPNVHVPIKNDNFLYTLCVVPLSNPRRHTDIIEKTKPTDRCRMCMVTWGPHTSKRVVDSGLAAHCVYCFDSAPSRHVSSFGRASVGVSIIRDVFVFEMFQLGSINVGAGLLDLLQVLLAMTEQQILVFGHFGLNSDQLSEQIFFYEVQIHSHHSLRALRVKIRVRSVQQHALIVHYPSLHFFFGCSLAHGRNTRPRVNCALFIHLLGLFRLFLFGFRLCPFNLLRFTRVVETVLVIGLVVDGRVKLEAFHLLANMGYRFSF